MHDVCVRGVQEISVGRVIICQMSIKGVVSIRAKIVIYMPRSDISYH